MTVQQVEMHHFNYHSIGFFTNLKSIFFFKALQDFQLLASKLRTLFATQVPWAGLWEILFYWTLY